MKILHITQFFHPNKGYQENSLAIEQRKNNHDVSIISSNDVSYWTDNAEGVKKIFDQDKKLFDEKNIKVIRIQKISRVSGRIIPSLYYDFFKKENPDVVFLHGVATPMSILGLYYCKKNNRKVKIIVDDHMVDAGSFNKYSRLFYLFFSFFYKVYLKILNIKIDKWVGVSEETVSFMKKNYGIKNKIEMIPLGFSSDNCYRDEEGGKIWLQDSNLPTDRKYILYIGKCDIYKRPIDLLEPFSKFSKKNEKYTLLIVGEGTGDYFKELLRIAETLHIKDKVLITPPVKNTDIRKVFSIAEVAIWPHGSSMAMLEAMVCGCPVIAGNLDVNKERLGNKRGILFTKDDFNSLYEKMLLFDDLKDEVVKNAELWVKDYKWENINKVFLKF